MLKVEEKLVFEAFIQAVPDFAGSRIVRWQEGSNPPDVLCFDGSGARIGVELTEWLDEGQIKSSIERDRLEASYLEGVRSEEITPPPGVGMVWLTTKIGKRLLTRHTLEFRTQLLDLIWRETREVCWRRLPQGLGVNDFVNYPRLEEYLQAIRILDRPVFPPGFAWICFPNKGGSYSPKSMVDALQLRIQSKTGARYADLRCQDNLEGLFLIVYYNKGLIHNTPFIAPGFGLEQVAASAARLLERDHGSFDRVFLFNAVKPDIQAIQIWPPAAEAA